MTQPRSCVVPRDHQQSALVPGTLTKHHLKWTETHDHPIYLCRGDYLSAVVEQMGIDVYVLARGPDGDGLARFDSPNHRHGPEDVEIVAQRSGVHRLEIGSIYEGEGQGDYELRIRELRPATQAERHHSLALQAKLVATPWMTSGSTDDLRRALSKIEESLGHQRAAGNLVGEAQALSELSGVHSALGNSLEALAALRACLELWRQVGDRRQKNLAQVLIAGLYASYGQRQKALDFFQWALATSRKEMDPLSQADAFMGMGNVLASMEEPEKALAAFQQALTMWRIHEHPGRQVRTLISIGAVHTSLGEHQKALEALQEALPLSRTEPLLYRNSQVLRERSRSLIALGRLDEAEAAARQSLYAGRRTGNVHTEISAVTALAAVSEARGDTKKALSLYHHALTYEGSDNMSQRRVYSDIARLELRRGRLSAALGAVRRAIEQLRAMTALIGERELKASFRAGWRHDHELHLEILMRLHGREPDHGWDVLALEAHEQARALSLIESLNETWSELRQGAEPSLLAEEREVLERLAEWRGELPEAKLDQAVLLARLQATQAQIRARSRGAQALKRSLPLGLHELQDQVLDSDTVLLEYALGKTRSFLFAVTTNEISVFSLPGRKQLEEDARSFYRLVRARGERLEFETSEDYAKRVREADIETRRVAFLLSRTLLAPAADLLHFKRLLIVADGALHFLPWNALPMPASQGALSDTPLIVDHELISAPSASVVAALRERKRSARPEKTLAVVADPVFETQESNLWQRLSARFQSRGDVAQAPDELLWSGPILRSFRGVGLGEFPPLPGSRREAEAILALVPEEERFAAMGFRADRDLILNGALRDFRIVHFATHGLLNSKYPDLSGIVLSLVDENDEPRNGFLRLYDIYQLEIAAELVVLSACQTALGKEVRGEGLDGLVRGFFYAGASQVVASLWSHEDQATAELMQRFYRNMLEDGRSPGDALRRAQISMWRQERWRAPYYWAGFVAHGDWRASP